MPLDGLSVIGSSPPPPVRKDGDRRPRREQPIIQPNIQVLLYGSDKYIKREIWRNMYTTRYGSMSLWDPCYVSVTEKDDPDVIAKLKESGFPIIRNALTESETYWEWIRLYHPAGEIYPHIQWGGVVKSIPGGDGGAGLRAWKLHALTLR